MPTVTFRCDVGPKVGEGHLVRCRQLAAELKARGADCVMVGPPADYASERDGELFADWAPRPDWPSSAEDAGSLCELAASHGSTIAVLDDYRVDMDYQQVVRAAGMRWMQQFDASRPQAYWADMVVNASPYETVERHADELLKPDAKSLFGPRYAILRPEFPRRRARDARDPVERVLVTFGGGDDQGCVVMALSALAGALDPAIEILVVSGARNPRNGEIAHFIAAQCPDRARLLVNPPDVAGVYASCDVAVLAAGTTGHELASCGVPMAMAALAENQVRQGLGWQELGAAAFLGRASDLKPDDIASAVAEICRNGEKRGRMAEIGPKLVDGQGASRLAECLLHGRLS